MSDIALTPTLAALLFLLSAALLRHGLKWLLRRLLPHARGLPGRFAGHRAVLWLRRADVALERRWPALAIFLRARISLREFHGLPLTVIVLAAAGIALLFSKISEEVLEGEEILAFDNALLAALEPFRGAPMLQAFIWITDLGNETTLIVAALVTTGFLWVERRGHLILGLWVTLVGAETMLWLAKFGFGRVRPEFLTEVTAASPSFPSGHTTGAMAVYGYIAYALARLARRPGAQFEIVFWGAVLIVLVGFSRVYLHVHYPSDVAAGFLTGALWLLVGGAIAEWYLRERLRLAEGDGDGTETERRPGVEP